MSVYYTATIFITVYLMIVMKMRIHNNILLEPDTRRILRIVSTIIIVTSLAEYFGVLLDGTDTSLRPLHICIKTIELAAAPSVPVIGSNIIGSIRKWKPVIAVFVIHAILEVISAFTGFIFYVDSSNVYHHGRFYAIYVVVLMAGILFFTWVTMRESRNQYGMRRMIIATIPALLICGLAFQYMEENVRIIWLCVALGTLMLYNTSIELTQNTDSLTHLLNRRYYENIIASLNKPAIIFYFDVDDFKNVNDTYGHNMGDKVLMGVGNSIQAVFARNGSCYRIGGDEFCAIMDIDESEAENYIEAFHANMDAVRDRSPETPYVSVGYARYNPKADNIEDVVSRADTWMYKNKRTAKTDRQ